MVEKHKELTSEKQLKVSVPSLPKLGTTQILTIALIIAVFLLGMLVTKVQYLERSGSSANSASAPVAPQAAVPNQPQAPAPGQKQNVDVGHITPIGDPNAKVKIVEFADFRCPFCDKFFTDTEPQIISDYVKTGKAVFYFRHFEFLGPASVVAGNAAECANEQGKFWDFHNYLYKNQPSESDTSLYTTDKLTQIAGTLGMNTTQFQSCLSANKFDKNVSDDLAAGQKVGVNGTPTIFVNGTPIVGAQPYSAFQTAIEAALK